MVELVQKEWEILCKEWQSQGSLCPRDFELPIYFFILLDPCRAEFPDQRQFCFQRVCVFDRFSFEVQHMIRLLWVQGKPTAKGMEQEARRLAGEERCDSFDTTFCHAAMPCTNFGVNGLHSSPAKLRKNNEGRACLESSPARGRPLMGPTNRLNRFRLLSQNK